MGFNLNDPLDKTNLMLDLMAKKQQAISANISNVSTPGYVRQDVNFGQYLDTVNSPIETKLSKKLGPSPLMNERKGKVSIAEELVALQKNSLIYTLATRRVNAIIQELKTVAQLGK
ncbi:MAG: flagellar basal body protein [bacterium]